MLNETKCCSFNVNFVLLAQLGDLIWKKLKQQFNRWVDFPIANRSYHSSRKSLFWFSSWGLQWTIAIWTITVTNALLNGYAVSKFHFSPKRLNYWFNFFLVILSNESARFQLYSYRENASTGISFVLCLPLTTEIFAWCALIIYSNLKVFGVAAIASSRRTSRHLHT